MMLIGFDNGVFISLRTVRTERMKSIKNSISSAAFRPFVLGEPLGVATTNDSPT